MEYQCEGADLTGKKLRFLVFFEGNIHIAFL